MSKAWKEGLQLMALGVGVTIVGLVAGAFLMSPGVAPEQRMLAMAGLGGAALLVLLADMFRRGLRAFRTRRVRRALFVRARHTGISRPATAAPPAVTLRGGRSAKTPRTVKALAAAGSPPAEIAWKTGLPLDAVSMLLQINGGALASR